LPLSSRQLIEFLEEVEKSLPRKITLVAAGGTAMTLYKLKASTIDVDFTGPGEDIELFRRAASLVQSGFKVDSWKDGQVFSQALPSDYLANSALIKRLKNIELRALSPIDIVVTKIGRLDARDAEDIKACIAARKLKKREIINRAKKVQVAGKEDLYEYNLASVIKEFFPN
jgi:hypothetical protein